MGSERGARGSWPQADGRLRARGPRR
ncbi:MAG: hypothetical protein WDO56_10400 [Gammaproteobacteria bacterium]